jgi:hypothetical protein
LIKFGEEGHSGGKMVNHKTAQKIIKLIKVNYLCCHDLPRKPAPRSYIILAGGL